MTAGAPRNFCHSPVTSGLLERCPWPPAQALASLLLAVNVLTQPALPSGVLTNQASSSSWL